MRHPAKARAVVKADPPPQAGLAEMSAAGLRAFFNIAGDWKLGVDEQLLLLGSPGRSTLFKWKASPASARLGRDTLERLSYLLGIYKALQILLPDPAAADAWVRKKNAAPLFGGRSALDRMLAGNVADLLAVRQYLDAMRGGWA
jgi:hypothetical protein